MYVYLIYIYIYVCVCIYVPGSGPPCVGCGLGREVVVYAVCSWYPPSPCGVGWGGKGAAYAVWGIDSSWCIQIYKWI